VLVRDPSKAIWPAGLGIELIQGDVRDPVSIAQAVRECEVIFHCAVGGGSRDACMAINVGGTRNVLQAAADTEVGRVVHLSSIAVQGPSPPDNADEQDEFRLTGNIYGDSKVAAEKEVWEFWQQRRLPIVVIRPTFVWGLGSPLFTVKQVQCMKSGEWFLVDRGRGTCHAVYIDNLVDALLLAGVKSAAVGEAFLITDGRPCTWAEFFGHYARMVGVRRLPSVSSFAARLAFRVVAFIDRLLDKVGPTPAKQPSRTFIRSVRRGLQLIRYCPARYAVFDHWDLTKYARRGDLNISKSRTLLGYAPRYSLEEGMRNTENWLRDHGII
jgi:nucleoside-diphosphate-sugar epimerase